MKLRSLLPALGLCAALAATAATCDATAPAGAYLNLTATAQREVPNNEFAAVAVVERSDRSSAATQVAVNQTVDAVAHSAQAAGLEFEAAGYETNRIEDVVKPGATSPPPAHWVTRATLQVKSHDLLALERWLGRASSEVAIERIVSSLSRASRETLLAQLRAEAIASFRAKASEAASAFGYARHEVAQVSVNDGDHGGPYPTVVPQARMALASVEPPPLTLSQGRTTVAVSVSGSVRLLDPGVAATGH